MRYANRLRVICEYAMDHTIDSRGGTGLESSVISGTLHVAPEVIKILIIIIM